MSRSLVGTQRTFLARLLKVFADSWEWADGGLMFGAGWCFLNRSSFRWVNLVHSQHRHRQHTRRSHSLSSSTLQFLSQDGTTLAYHSAVGDSLPGLQCIPWAGLQWKACQDHHLLALIWFPLLLCRSLGLAFVVWSQDSYQTLAVFWCVTRHRCI